MLSHHLEYQNNSARVRLGVAGVIAVLVGAFIMYPGVSTWVATADQIATLDSEITDYQTQLTETRSTYRELKVAYAETAARDAVTIDTVLPETPRETHIVRRVEEAAAAITASGHMQLKSIKFSSTRSPQDAAYDLVPFRVSVNANENTLDELLRFFESSGSLEAADPIRLFRVEDVSITINENVDPRLNRGPIDAELTIHAYAFRPQHAAGNE